MLAEAGINPDDPGSWLDEQLRAAGALAPGTSVAGLWARPLVTSLGERGFNHHVLALRVEYSTAAAAPRRSCRRPRSSCSRWDAPAPLQREREFYTARRRRRRVRRPRAALLRVLAPTGRRTKRPPHPRGAPRRIRRRPRRLHAGAGARHPRPRVLSCELVGRRWRPARCRW